MTILSRAFAAFLLCVPVLASAQSTKDASPKTSLRMLGVARVRGVQEKGFYNTEAKQSGELFRWTNGSARLIVPFAGPVPAALHVRLGLGVPKPTKLTIRVNSKPLFDETVQPQPEWSRTFELAEAVTDSPMTIEILSDTFTPTGGKNQADDDRTLGVCVLGMTIVDTAQDYTGLNLAAEPAPGVSESGFYHSEMDGDQPCRWTDGHAKLTVPAPDGGRWKSLTVMAWIPKRANYRVRVAVNGRPLFDDVLKPGAIWTKEFSLEGIDMDRKAVIELSSDTMAPGEIRKTETRTLGIRLRELVLWDR
jgi:hypothetical protein